MEMLYEFREFMVLGCIVALVGDGGADGLCGGGWD
jgi:hypothetical protein